MRFGKQIAILGLALATIFAGCGEETAERAGERLGEATRQAEKAAKEGVDSLNRGVEKFKQGYRDAGRSSPESNRSDT